MNAIILCAGLGTRFRPLSWITPKPLTPINGVPIVEQTIKNLQEAGIKNISLVTGFKKECFEFLKDKYKVDLIFNDLYESANNQSSLKLVRDRLNNSFIVDGDLFFLRNIFKEVDKNKSQFISQQTIRGLEWELIYDENYQIKEVIKNTSAGYGMVGVSYWQGEAAQELAKELDNSQADEFWEDAAIRVMKKSAVYIKLCKEPFVQELDKVKDAVDMKLLSHKEVARLACTKGFPVRLKGLTNSTWKIVDHEGKEKCLRIPGAGTEKFIKREHEPIILSIIENDKISPKTNFYPEGLKVTDFLSGHRVATQKDMIPAFFESLASLLDILHKNKYSEDLALKPYYIKNQILLYEEQSGNMAAKKERDWLMKKAKYFDHCEQVLCHRDLLLENIMISDDKGKNMNLIDFEYSGFTHPLWDAASFILEAEIKGEVRQNFLKACKLSAAEQEELIDMEILVDYVWGMWGVVNNYEDYAISRLRNYKMKLMERLAS